MGVFPLLPADLEQRVWALYVCDVIKVQCLVPWVTREHMKKYSRRSIVHTMRLVSIISKALWRSSYRLRDPAPRLRTHDKLAWLDLSRSPTQRREHLTSNMQWWLAARSSRFLYT